MSGTPHRPAKDLAPRGESRERGLTAAQCNGEGDVKQSGQVRCCRTLGISEVSVDQIERKGLADRSYERRQAQKLAEHIGRRTSRRKQPTRMIDLHRPLL